MRKGNLGLIAVALVVVALTASGAIAQVRIGGERWQLMELNGKRFSNSRIYVEFEEGKTRLSGNAGCNRFFAEYEFDGQSFKVDSVGSTKMACLRPGVMETEREFLNALGAATNLRKRGINLDLFNGKNRALRFRSMVKDPAGGVSDLTAMKWMLKAIGGVPVSLENDAPFLNFDSGRKSAGGNSGCNVFGGNYEVDGSAIKFSHIISTMRACEFEDRMTVERGFMSGLENADRFEIGGKKLTIFKGSEVLLEFEGVAK